MDGTDVPGHFKVFAINGTHGTVYAVGNDTANGNTEFFRIIAHRGADGTMNIIGSTITSKGMVGIQKGVVYSNGTGVLKVWLWK